MGRFKYIPVPYEMIGRSKHGQVISDLYSGHLYLNHHNVIVSATERIESKLDDVFQIESNIVEQKNVINNLDSDFTYLMNTQYAQVLSEFQDLRLTAMLQEADVKFLQNGIYDYEQGTKGKCILSKLLNDINDMMVTYTKTATYQSAFIDYSNIFLNGNLKNYNGIITNGINHFDGTSVIVYRNKITESYKTQRDEINLIKNTILGKL